MCGLSKEALSLKPVMYKKRSDKNPATTLRFPVVNIFDLLFAVPREGGLTDDVVCRKYDDKRKKMMMKMELTTYHIICILRCNGIHSICNVRKR